MVEHARDRQKKIAGKLMLPLFFLFLRIRFRHQFRTFLLDKIVLNFDRISD